MPFCIGKAHRQGQKKNAAHFCAARFPVYNLMKSFESVVNVRRRCSFASCSLIDDTKVRQVGPRAKDKKTYLLNSCFALVESINGAL